MRPKAAEENRSIMYQYATSGHSGSFSLTARGQIMAPSNMFGIEESNMREDFGFIIGWSGCAPHRSSEQIRLNVIQCEVILGQVKVLTN